MLITIYRILDLSACRGISSESLQMALPQLRQLEVLHLEGNPEVGLGTLCHCAVFGCGVVLVLAPCVYVLCTMAAAGFLDLSFMFCQVINIKFQ